MTAYRKGKPCRAVKEFANMAEPLNPAPEHLPLTRLERTMRDASHIIWAAIGSSDAAAPSDPPTTPRDRPSIPPPSLSAFDWPP